MLAHLLQEYQERPISFGIAPNGRSVIELLSSPNGETWTLLLTRPDGTSCLIGSGESWQAASPPKEDAGQGT